MRLCHGIGLATFCLFAGSGWLVDAEWPDTVPSLLSQSFVLLLAGLFSLSFSLRDGDAGLSKTMTMQLAAASFLLLVAPAVLAQTAPSIRPETSVVLYALAPICLVGVVTLTDETARTLLAPCLAGLAGTLLILPWRVPSDGAGAVSFAKVLFAVLLTAGASVWMHTLLKGKRLARALSAIAFTGAVALGLAGFARGERLPVATGLGAELFRALLLDLPQIFLLVWLLRDMEPERLASRFFFVPFVTILEGLLVLRGSLDLRTVTGMSLLLFGAGSLMFTRHSPAARLDLR